MPSISRCCTADACRQWIALLIFLITKSPTCTDHLYVRRVASDIFPMMAKRLNKNITTKGIFNDLRNQSNLCAVVLCLHFHQITDLH